MTDAATRFSEGTAVVTGGGAGIGEGLVRHLAALGMHVVVADISRERAAAVAHDVQASGGQATAHVVDVTDADAVDALADRVFGEFGSVEFLLNNAGVETGGFLWEIPVERWRQLVAINVSGVFHGIRSFLPRMIELGSPAIVANLSSVGGVGIAPLQAPYIVSKHAVLSLTECLYQEIALVGAPIQVSAILPYSIRSQIFVDAQAVAPSRNQLADRVFDSMQEANVATGLDPVTAAEHMLESIGRGDFWVFSDDDYGRAAVIGRAEYLANMGPPPPLPEQYRMMLGQERQSTPPGRNGK